MKTLISTAVAGLVASLFAVSAFAADPAAHATKPSATTKAEAPAATHKDAKTTKKHEKKHHKATPKAEAPASAK